ncbi:uncharacterized protein LOC118280506 [Spodoptera frugiperda]|uniref:Uncharacterized protein LOC118280506 n=1 Tax=Spodoptera frugiperda TaxID=7108 RepID=A0A9R0DJJ4_SPOFR|nr:uncharacterized protein LOC118280506 [Spodoptera frugiperda]
MIMARCLCVFLLSLVSQSLASVIIPEELPSLLSVAYSNIPPIKKGTDSRVGFGFAFGNHADFQVMFELGPQTNTQALNGQGFQSTSSNTKRQVNSPPPAKLHKNKEKYHSDASKYLQNWAQKMKYPEKHAQNVQKLGEVPNLEESMVELVKNDKGEYEIHQPKPGNLPQNILEDLKKLYKLKSEAAKKMGETKRSEEEVKKITEDLSNVDLD